MKTFEAVLVDAYANEKSEVLQLHASDATQAKREVRKLHKNGVFNPCVDVPGDCIQLREYNADTVTVYRLCLNVYTLNLDTAKWDH